MRKLRKILLPFGCIYGGITFIRNFCYDRGWFSTQNYDFPVIGVGNLSVGGTGKSPMVEYLIRLFKEEYGLATLSRGYGRKTTGFIEVNTASEATRVGDEPLQFKRKFPEVRVAVDENRSRGIARLRKGENSPRVLILDDVYQHRRVTPGFLILLTAYNDFFYDDLLLPAGNLRECRRGAKRADCVIVTKCQSDLEENRMDEIRAEIRNYTSAPVFYTSISYGQPQNDLEKLEWSNLGDFQITLVTGIANPSPLVGFLNSRGIEFEHLEFKDHHNFRPAEIAELDSKPIILCTEKDYVRLSGNLLRAQLYYIPIEIIFLRNAEIFDADLREFVAKSVD